MKIPSRKSRGTPNNRLLKGQWFLRLGGTSSREGGGIGFGSPLPRVSP